MRSSVKRLRVPLSPLVAGVHRVTGDPAHYLVRVHRLAPGDGFTAFDPEAVLEADAVVLGTDKRGVECRFEAPRAAGSLVRSGVTLIVAKTKGGKVDDVIRAATALGVTRIVVAESERSVVGAGPEPDKRAVRYRAVAVDAARQSGRGDLPSIEGSRTLDQVLEMFAPSGAHKICLAPEAPLSLAAALSARGSRELLLLVGPEGGFSVAELERVGRAGFALARFGELVLRAELAAVAALGAVLAQSPMQNPERQ